ncbi:unnamed protein product [Meganyctiphanes norvegica]|uniref:Major facilitator superfamily associated domain-containing protein n=1 Tax=Meganyctiphanes norvegica TaxID=48144 RepID=A0AAV2RHA5_MEGNR
MFEKFINDLRVNFLSYDLMPLKFLFFMMYAANMALVPFLAVHLQSLGFGADKAAVVYAIIPLVAILGPPIAGAIADKIGNFKIFFSFMVVASGGLALPLLLVPSVPHPPGLVLTLLTDNSINELAEQLVLAEKGKMVDAEYLHFLLITNQTGCDIHEEYHTTMDGIKNVDIFSAEPKASTNITRILRKGNVTLLALTTHHPIACPNNTRKILPNYAAALLPEILNDYNTTALNLTVEGNLANNSIDAWWKSGCSAAVPGLCIPHQKNLVQAEAFSFWSYLGVRTLLNVATNAGFTLFEGATLSMIKAHEGDYGLQRMWGYIGTMLLTPFSGWTIDYFSKRSEAADFRSAFYLFLGLQILAGLIALSVNLEFKSPSKRVLKNIYKFLTNFEVLMLLVACFLAGAFFGFLEAFLFWFLGDLGASRSLMGLTITTGAAVAVPFVIFSSYITERLGYANVIGLSFLMYSIRFAGYACISDPSHALYFESLEGITTGLLLTTTMMYAAELSTTESIVSLQALCATVHHGIGKGVGSLVGGYMYYHMGARKTFRMMTVYSMISSVGFFIYNLYLRQRLHKRATIRRKSAAIERVRSIKLTKERARASKRLSKMDQSEMMEMERHMSSKSFKSLVSQTSVESVEKELLQRQMSSRSERSIRSNRSIGNGVIRKMGGQSYTILSVNDNSDTDSEMGEEMCHMGTQTNDADWKMLRKVNSKKYKPKKKNSSSKSKYMSLPLGNQNVVQVEQETQVEGCNYGRRGTLVEQDESNSQDIGIQMDNEVACQSSDIVENENQHEVACQSFNYVDVDKQHEVACQSSNDILHNEEPPEEDSDIADTDKLVYSRQETIVCNENESENDVDKSNFAMSTDQELEIVQKDDDNKSINSIQYIDTDENGIEDENNERSIENIDQDKPTGQEKSENNENEIIIETEQLEEKLLEIFANKGNETTEEDPINSDIQDMQDREDFKIDSSSSDNEMPDSINEGEKSVSHVNEMDKIEDNRENILGNSTDKINGFNNDNASQIDNRVQSYESEDKDLDYELENKEKNNLPSESENTSKNDITKHNDQGDFGLETNQRPLRNESINRDSS